ncbi:RagB/SusD family nutrient uptake outer membrane protein [Aquimarina pacifica]|uniref:RagB/SusD family nutrient uptake outer membrane protein n=1 Tax=Aquimarina pacifica TaxID=1296415 RepID=UPI0009DF1ABE|nr:RagB/SusD family nutrient uptake outer membrane protein [Aquimarina pacifica]
MKKIKTFRFKYVLVLVMIVATTSECTDLDLQPLDAVTEENFFLTEVDFKGATLASYSSMQSLFATTEQNYPAFNEWFKVCYVTSDMVNTFSWNFDILNFSKFRVLDTNPGFQYVYVTIYQGIHRANLVLEKIDTDNELTADEKILYEAEAKFLRAWFHFQSYKIWGGHAPLMLETTTDINNLVVGNSTPEATITAILEDFSFASANLPTSWDDSNLGRATAWTAKSYLGKTHLYNKDFERALPEFQDVYNNGPYSLMPTYDEVFDVSQENNSESIFEIQFAGAADDNGWVLDDFHPENFKATQGFNRESDIGIWSYKYKPSPKYFEVSEDDDPRVATNIYQLGDTYYTAFESYTLEWIDQSDGTTNTLIKKYRGENVPKMAPSNGAVDYNNERIFRFADLILMYAETLIETGGDTGLATNLINEVRLRSYPTATPIASGLSTGDLTDALRLERGLELFFEGHRYFDLVRWGIAQETFDAIDATEDPNAVITHSWGTRTANGLFPIPQTEIDKSGGVLTQIPGL